MRAIWFPFQSFLVSLFPSLRLSRLGGLNPMKAGSVVLSSSEVRGFGECIAAWSFLFSPSLDGVDRKRKEI